MIVFFNVYYIIKKKKILENITFQIKNQEKVLIVGESGTGKSTILNILIKNIKPTKGKIYYDKEDIFSYNEAKTNQYRHQKIKIIYQTDDLFDDLTVMDNLLLYYYSEDILTIFKKANLSYLKNRLVYTLSGGERQRIAIIKACLGNFEVLLCDEITSALDKKNAINIIDFILTMYSNKTIIFISHDKTLFENKIEHLIELESHKIKENQLIQQKINNPKQYVKSNKEKSLFLFSLQRGFKKISFSQMIIFYICIISFLLFFNFNDLFIHFAKKSYTRYFNYDVVEIKDSINNFNDSFVYYGLEEFFLNCKIYINNHPRENIIFLPFNNKDRHSKIVINQLFLENQNFQNINSFKIKHQLFEYECEKIDIIEEKGMFVTPCVYYDIVYFNTFNLPVTSQKYLLNFDFTKYDNRLTNNPLYYEKKEDKPYADSNAYHDYLTFEMVFNSIKDIVNYFFLIVLLFSIIITILLFLVQLLKDQKIIAIYKSNGYSDLIILSTYLLPIGLYSLPIFILLIKFKLLLFPLLISFFIQIFFIILIYKVIKKQNLHQLLKEDTLL